MYLEVLFKSRNSRDRANVCSMRTGRQTKTIWNQTSSTKRCLAESLQCFVLCSLNTHRKDGNDANFSNELFNWTKADLLLKQPSFNLVVMSHDETETKSEDVEQW